MRMAADSDTTVPSGSISTGILAAGLMRRNASISAGALPTQTSSYAAPISSSIICGARDPAPCLAYKRYGLAGMGTYGSICGAPILLSAQACDQRAGIGVQSHFRTLDPDQDARHQRLATVLGVIEAGSGARWKELYTEKSCGSSTRMTASAIVRSMQAFLFALDGRSPWSSCEHALSAAKRILW